MKTALLRLFSSMKFWTLLLGLVTSLGAKYGLGIDPDTYWSIVGLFGLLLGVQGLNDHGKGKAEIEARNVQNGFARRELLIIIALLVVPGALGVVVGCATFKNEAKHAAADAVDCMEPKLVDRANELVGVIEQAVPPLLSDTGKIDRAGFKSLTQGLKSDAAGCAIATVVARLSKPRGQDSQASPLAVDVPELEAAWADTRREQFGGRTFLLGAGS